MLDIVIINYSNLHVPLKKRHIKAFINSIQKCHKCTFSYVELIYLTTKNIIKLNQKYLHHNYETDILTFSYHDDTLNKESIEATLCCCTSYIYEQAKSRKIEHILEFSRVIIHGLLHLAGFNDNTKEKQNEMVKWEDYHIRQYYPWFQSKIN